MKRAASLALLGVALCACAHDAQRSQEGTRIAVVATIPHPSAEACIDGFQRGFAAAGGGDAILLRHFGDGEPASLARAVDSAIRERPQLLLALGSAAIREACARDLATPVVATWCFDLAAACAGPGGERILGVETPPPVRAQVGLLSSIEPTPSRVGVVYAPTETIAVRQVEEARRLLADHGIDLEEARIAGIDEVDVAVRDLARRGVDAVWKLGDTTVARVAESLFAACSELRLPVVGDAEAQLQQGAVAVAFVDFRAAGERAGRLAAGALTAGSATSLARQRLDAPRLARNEDRLREFGLRIR